MLQIYVNVNANSQINNFTLHYIALS